MSETIMVLVNGIERHIGRLVGVIDDEECRAVVNTEDAAKKIFTSESIPLNALAYCNNKRFVVATEGRRIFISPKVRLSYHYLDKRNFTCEDNNEYTLKTLRKKE